MAVSDTAKPAEPGPNLWPLSVQAYRTLGELGLVPKSTELLYGQIYQKLSKSPLHSALVRRLLRLLHRNIPPGCFLSSEQPISCAESEPEPDIAVVHGAEEDFWQEHPKTAKLVVEVCVTSFDYDRSKLRAYAEAQVNEVWFVLVPDQQIEVYRQPIGSGFAARTVHGPGGSFTSPVLPGFTLNLAALFEN